MGLNTMPNLLWLSVQDGLLLNDKKGIKARSYTGTLVSVKQVTDIFKEEGKDDKPINKIEVRLKDTASDEIACVKFYEWGAYAQGFFARVKSADVSKPIELAVSNQPERPKICYCWIKQDGVIIPEDKTNFPQPTKTTKEKDGKTIEVNNYEPCIAFYPSVIADLTEKIEKTKGSVAETAEATIPSESEGEDLPF